MMMLLPRRNFEMDLFDDMFKDPFFSRSRNLVMKTDITEDGDKYNLSMELPGFGKDDVKIEIDDGYLTVSASKETSTKRKNKIISIRKDISENANVPFMSARRRRRQYQAHFENGVLNVSFPKAAAKNSIRKNISPLNNAIKKAAVPLFLLHLIYCGIIIKKKEESYAGIF
jgi:HSP20 family molecular chaperone IbpA